MAGYLRKFVGIYEVRADYDLDTNDFPRDISGTVDPSFDDYYINCDNGIKIRHATGSTLSCYIPSTKRGTTILQQASESINIIESEILDGEVYFTFFATDIDVVAKLCKAKTKGKNTQPLSPTTLPKKRSIIPEDEMNKYKKLFNKLGGETPLQKGQIVRVINREFEKQLPECWKAESKKLTLDFRSYVYHIGKWGEYLDIIKENAQS